MEGENSTPPVPSSPNKLVGASGKVYKESLKYNEWVRLILDKTRRDTFGNFTQAALIVYNLDENDPKQYATASAMGSQNFRKLKDLSSLILQKKGITFGFLMDILIAKTANSQSSTWWEILAEMMGYRERRPQVSVSQNNQYNIYTPVSDEQLNEQFKDITVEAFREEELIKVFIEGDVSAGPEQSPSLALHQEEFRDADSEDERLPSA